MTNVHKNSIEMIFLSLFLSSYFALIYSVANELFQIDLTRNKKKIIIIMKIIIIIIIKENKKKKNFNNYIIIFC